MRQVFVKLPGFLRFRGIDRDTSPEPPKRAPHPGAGLADAAWAVCHIVKERRSRVPRLSQARIARVSWRLRCRRSVRLLRTFYPWRCVAPHTRDSIQEA